METQNIKKIHVLYLLCYILVPIGLIVLCGWLGAVVYSAQGSLASMLMVVPTVLSFLWWTFGGRWIYHRKKASVEKKLEEEGFTRNHTFNGGGCTVMVDVNRGQVALVFFWNPFDYFVFPVSRISKAWVDDGRHGIGFMEGSSRVSFLLLVDDVKVRVNTFTSNKRWRMDSKYILTGISKADMMVKVLEAAGAKVG